MMQCDMHIVGGIGFCLFQQALHQGRACLAETVDRLLDVADAEEIGTGGDPGDDLILQEAGILEFIDQDLIIGIPEDAGNRTGFRKDVQCEPFHVRKSHGGILSLICLIAVTGIFRKIQQCCKDTGMCCGIHRQDFFAVQILQQGIQCFVVTLRSLLCDGVAGSRCACFDKGRNAGTQSFIILLLRTDICILGGIDKQIGFFIGKCLGALCTIADKCIITDRFT